MKLLRRNTRTFEYLPNTGEETDLNADGEHTGVLQPVYDDPIEKRGNISTPSGQTTQTFYGEDIRYTHVLLMDTPDPDIHEDGMVRWNGDEYEVRAVHPSLNSVSIALRKLTKSHWGLEEAEPDEEPTGETGVTGVTGDGDGGDGE